jgi:hypothetical protein
MFSKINRLPEEGIVTSQQPLYFGRMVYGLENFKARMQAFSEKRKLVTNRFLVSSPKLMKACSLPLPIPSLETMIEPLWPYLQAFAWFQYDLYNSTSLREMAVAIARFIVTNCSFRSLCEFCNYIGESVTTSFAGLFDMIHKAFEADFGSLYKGCTMGVDVAKQMLAAIKILPTSAAVSTSSKVLMGVLAMPVVQSLGLDFSASGLLEFQKHNLKKFVFTSTIDMVKAVLEMYIAVAEVGHQCWTEKSLRPLLRANDKVTKWTSRVAAIENDLATRYTDIDYDTQATLDKISDLITEGECIALDTEHKYFMKEQLLSLQKRRRELLMKHSVSAYRKAPYAILIAGPPGIGKSSIIQQIASYYQKTVAVEKIMPDLEWNPNIHMYTRNPRDDYWSGYKGARQWCVVADDLALENSKHVIAGKTNSVDEIIRIVNTVGMATNQASIEDKGVIPIYPKLFIGSTNVKNLNAHLAVEDPTAVLRRFKLYITPFLKDEYRDPNTGVFASTSEVVRDAWVYQVQKYKISFTNDGKWKGEFVYQYPPAKASWSDDDDDKFTFSASQLFALLRTSIIDHENSGDMMTKACRDDAETELCEECKIFKFCCSCVKFKGVSETVNKGFISSGFDLLQTHVVDRVSKIADGSVAAAKKIRNESIVLMFSPLVKAIGVEETIRMIAEVYFDGTDEVRERIIQKLKAHGDTFVHKMIEVSNDLRKPEAFRLRSSMLLKAAAGSALLVGLYGLYQSISDSQKNATLKPKEPETLESKYKATGGIWASTKDCILPKEKALKGDGLDLVRTVSKSMIHITVQNLCETSAWEARQSGFSLGDGNVVTAGHIFDKKAKSYIVEILYAPETSLNPAMLFTVQPNQLTFMGEDLVILNSLNNIPRRNLLTELSAHEYREKGKVKVVKRDPKGHLIVDDGHITGYEDFMYTITAGEPIHLRKTPIVVKRGDDGQPIPTKYGDCGSLVLVETPVGWKIHSMIVAGEHANNGAAIILKADHFSQRKVLYAFESENPKYLQGTSSSGPMLTQHPEHNMATWSGGGFGEVIGRFKTRIQGNSRVCYTKHGEELEKLLPIAEVWSAPKMRVVCEDGIWLNCWALSMKHQINPATGFNENALRLCMMAYFEDVKAGLGERIHEIRPYTLTEAINGVKGDPFVNRLPMNTSGGMRYPGGKLKWLVEDDEGLLHPGPELLEELHEAEEAWQSNKTHGFMLNGCLKDEPVTQKKAKLGKTRVFTMADFSLIILERMQFLGIAKMMMTNTFITECTVGMNCYSDQAEALYNYLTCNGELCDQMIAGDFEKFDKRLCALILKICFEFMTLICKESGNFDHDDILNQLGIATELSYPVTNYNGDVYRMFGGNSSGHSMTVHLNSIANSILMRYAFMMTTGRHPNAFKEYVRLATHGDDNAMSSRDVKFNHTSIAETLKAHGIGYTMAEKTAESVPFINIEDVDFLKRKFRELCGRIVMPLDRQSIYKSLIKMVDGAQCTKSKQSADAYLAARREMALHGEEEFDRFIAIVDPIMRGDPDIANEMIDKHFLGWESTFGWVCSTTESAQGDIDQTEEEEVVLNMSGVSAMTWSYEGPTECSPVECVDGIFPFCHSNTSDMRYLSDEDRFSIVPLESLYEQTCNLWPVWNFWVFNIPVLLLKLFLFYSPVFGLIWNLTGADRIEKFATYAGVIILLAFFKAIEWMSYLYVDYPRYVLDKVEAGELFTKKEFAFFLVWCCIGLHDYWTIFDTLHQWYYCLVWDFGMY